MVIFCSDNSHLQEINKQLKHLNSKVFRVIFEIMAGWPFVQPKVSQTRAFLIRDNAINIQIGRLPYRVLKAGRSPYFQVTHTVMYDCKHRLLNVITTKVTEPLCWLLWSLLLYSNIALIFLFSADGTRMGSEDVYKTGRPQVWEWGVTLHTDQLEPYSQINMSIHWSPCSPITTPGVILSNKKNKSPGSTK